MRSKWIITATVLCLITVAQRAANAEALKVHPPVGNSGIELLQLAHRTLDFVAESKPIPALAEQLARLDEQIQNDPHKANQLRDRIQQLRRKILFEHPLLDFDKLLINLRPVARASHMCDQYLGRHSGRGDGLAILENWKHSPTPKLLVKDKLPTGSILHPDLSFDAARILFSFCDHTVSDGRQRAFYVYEAAIDGSWVRQITGTNADPMKGWGDRQTVLIEDFDPFYLPDGGFGMITTRTQTYGRCHGTRYVPTYMLFRSELDGSNIHQLSYSEANEWDPSMMHDGRIVYTRWDYINRHDVQFQSFWTIRPDGTDTRHFYGNYSRTPCMTAEAKAVPHSRLVVGTGTAHHSRTEGSIFVVDPLLGQDGLEPISKITPEARFPESQDSSGGGAKFATPYPVSEEMYFVSHPGRGRRYSIYLIDILGGRELIYSSDNSDTFSPIPVQPRPTPPILASTIAGKEEEDTGVFYVQNVYDCTEPLEPGSIKRLRINQIYGQPTNAKPDLSKANNENIKGILGTVPVNSNGSVAFRAPAGVPLQLQAIDENGMAVMTMRSLVFLQPGEVASCVGCHEHRNKTPDRTLPQTITVHEPAPSAGPQYAGGFSFLRTVQPVLDRHCIRCHGLDKTEANLNLLGTRKGRYNTAHDSLTGRGGLVKIAYRNNETPYSKPKDYFAHAGRLAKYLLNDHRKYVDLDRESFQCIVDWLDLNAQYYGDYSFNRIEKRNISRNGERALREHIKQLFGANLAAQPIDALINVAQPDQSRILNAPLTQNAGGWGQINTNPFKTKNDPAYKKMLQLIDAAIEPLQYNDIAGTCNKENCQCQACWVRKLNVNKKIAGKI